MAQVNVNTLTTKLNGKGITFADFYYRTSPLFASIFFDWESLMKPTMALKPKLINLASELAEDGFTLKWRDTDLRRSSASLSAPASSGATTIVLQTGEGALFFAGDQIYVPSTNTAHIVTSISTDTLTITPAVPAAGFASSAAIKISSHAIDTDGTVGGKSVFLPVGDETTNYIQNFSYQMTFTQLELNSILLKYTTSGATPIKAAQMYITEKQNHVLRQMMHDFANAFYVGKKATATISGKTYNYTGGVEEYKDSTVIDCTDTTDKGRLVKVIDALDSASAIQSTDSKYPNILVCTRRAKSRITNLAMQFATGARIEDVELIKKIGFNITVIKTTYGDIPVYADPILTEITNDANIGYIMNPQLITMASTTFLPANINSKFNDQTTINPLSGIIYHKDQTASVQPNSPLIVNAYTNFGFKFGGSSVKLMKKLINLGE